MNNFNNVFLVIKKHCGEKGEVCSEDCFGEIARDAGIPLIKIEFYLSTMQNLQLIKYSIEEHYVRLTQFGRKQERLFTES